jgi:aerobic carbon-monoxide dehydrogenase medium subunit
LKPARFSYFRPACLEEALGLLAEHGDDAVPLAGGQSLVAMMNFRIARPAILVDVNELAEIATIRSDEAGVSIGALVRQRTLERSPQVAAYCPLLPAAVAHVGTPQTRNRGTIGGSICHADPHAELPAVMVACDASLTLRSATAERKVAAREFFYSTMVTARRRDELLTMISIPRQGRAFAFQELSSPARAPATVAVAITTDPAGVVSTAVCGIGDIPVLVSTPDQLASTPGSHHRIAVAAELMRRGREQLDRFTTRE